MSSRHGICGILDISNLIMLSSSSGWQLDRIGPCTLFPQFFGATQQSQTRMSHPAQQDHYGHHGHRSNYGSVGDETTAVQNTQRS